MALTTCQECSAPVSDQAGRCPRCGAPTPRASDRRRNIRAWLGVLLVVVALALVAWRVTNVTGDAEREACQETAAIVGENPEDC